MKKIFLRCPEALLIFKEIGIFVIDLETRSIDIEQFLRGLNNSKGKL